MPSATAVHMLDAGATQEEVKDHLGHKYIQTTDIYAAISGRKKKAGVREDGES